MSTLNVSKKRGGGRRAFTIIEVIVIITIIGIIAAVIAPRLISRIGASRTATAKASAASLVTAMRIYLADGGTTESGVTLNVLMDQPSGMTEGAWKGPYMDSKDALLDPWGRPFELVVPGKKNFEFDIVSYGKDGQPGGEGEDVDIIAP